MSTFKCKMCGGALEITGGATVATCEYCGTQQTLPRLDDDRRANLYDRANHFRRSNEFDKAMGIYEQILAEDNADAEAYWSLVLCRYGIEYVEDPTSHRRVPTVNRAQYTSIFDDENYKSALQYADSFQRGIYEEEAKAINEIQKGILAISQKEEPFDVFICYKESDSNGRRTQDSVLANDLYHQLTQEGFKVFFSRITLEDKLGSAYEPYIFAALNSAKIMVVLGTRPEYFNAVWVKNEWSRYLALIRQGQKKMLIPAYKDMDPYDLPEEFSHLQAQDMSKLGFMQDLIRGIKKIAQTDEPKPTVVKETIVTGGGADTAPLLKRAFMFLEDGEWASANEYCEKVLDIDPENAQAYLGKLMASTQAKTKDALKDCLLPLEELDSGDYQKILRFGDKTLVAELTGCNEYIINRNENTRLSGIYGRAKSIIAAAQTEKAYLEAARLFESIRTYQDAAELEIKCREAAEVARKDAVLAAAEAKMKLNTIEGYKEAIVLFAPVSGWRDADERVLACQKRIKELEAERDARLAAKAEAAAARMKKAKKAAVIVVALLAVGVAAYFTVTKIVIPKRNAELLNRATVGDLVYFGSYEQDNNLFDGKETIEWLVLDIQDGRALLISRYGLDCKPYANKIVSRYEDITWETCSLREWLNSDFIDKAFSAEERELIPTVTVGGEDSQQNTTQDQVFLLSVSEAKEYFSSDDARVCKPTDYAVAHGAYVNKENGNAWWWVRASVNKSGTIAYVDGKGSISGNSEKVTNGKRAVRPAIWVELGA